MNKTSIEWTKNGYTWNPTTGCTHVSDGCKFCYAEALSLRFGRSKHPWIKPYEQENVKLHPERLKSPFTVKESAYCFVDSMADLFHELVPLDYLAKVFAVMAATPNITYQILTKRPERMAEILNKNWLPDIGIPEAAEELAGEWGWCHIWGNHPEDPEWPLPNVWVGTSVEDQRVTDRIDHLIRCPGAVHFLSCEPLIGPLDLTPWLWDDAGPEWAGKNPSRDLDWIIVGGESGPHHRPFDIDWARQIRDDCVEAGVAFFLKQIGGRTPKAGGRLLDGRTWDQMPGDPQREAEAQMEMAFA